MKTCYICHQRMYGSKHHLICDDCYKVKKKRDNIPENKLGQPIYAKRKGNIETTKTPYR